MLKEYLREFNPDIIVLVETIISGPKAVNVIRRIGFSNSHRVEARGFSGGIWVLWKSSFDVLMEVNNF